VAANRGARQEGFQAVRLYYLILRSDQRGRLWEGHNPFQKAKYLHALTAAYLPSRGLHLDLGCGDGEILAEFRPSCTMQVGLDVNVTRLAQCRRVGMPVAKADLRNPLPVADGRVDVITLISILEHIEDPGRLMPEVSRVLAPGGVAVIQIPNPRFLVDLHYFLPFYGWIPERFRGAYRALLKGEKSASTTTQAPLAKRRFCHCSPTLMWS
jgi:SAM-dependent methyltransferase